MSDSHHEFIHSQQQWEHTHLEAPAAESLNDKMKEAGREGWELVSVVYSHEIDVWHSFLKRPRASSD